MIMLRAFLPWIIFYILLHLFSLSVLFSALITLISFIVLCHRDLQRGYIMTWLSPIFLLAIILNVQYFHWIVFQQHPAAIFYAALAIVSWGSIILKLPFTLQYSRAGVSQAKWHHPVFLEVNYILSSLWAVIFTINLSINCLFSAAGYLRPLTYLFTAFGMYAAIYFPDWYRKRWRTKTALSS